MKKILHVISTPRGDESRTLKVSKHFLAELKKKYPKTEVDTLDLFKEKLPDLTAKSVNGKYVLLGGKDMPEDLRASWNEIIRHIERFLAADLIVISAPMWNFANPYKLKQYIDIVVQPKYMFKYTASGVEGLVKGKKMVIITSRGGDYSGGSPYDLQEPYLRLVFGFIGITDISFISAQPMDAMGPEVAVRKIEDAKRAAAELAAKI